MIEVVEHSLESSSDEEEIQAAEEFKALLNRETEDMEREEYNEYLDECGKALEKYAKILRRNNKEEIHFKPCPKAEKQIEEAFSDLF